MTHPQFQTFKKVAWLDGQFLYPQHFQQQERYLEQRLEMRCRSIQYNSWGFSKLILDESLLLKGKIGLTYAEGIMPDGTPFSLPGMAPLPEAVDIPRDACQLNVYLALPMYQPGNLTIGHQDVISREVRYKKADVHIYDDSDSSKGTQRLETAELAFSLKFESSDRGGFDSMGICQISEVTHTGIALLCEDYLAPSYVLSSNDKLNLFLSNCINVMSTHANILSDRLISLQDSGIPLNNTAIVDIRLLELLNGAEAQLFHWQTIQSVHPEAFFQLLLILDAQLSSYTLERRSLTKIHYLHHNLRESIPPLIKSLRTKLDSLLKQTAVPIPLELYENGIRLAEIKQQDLLKHGRFIVGVQSAVMSQLHLKQAMLEKTKICERDEMVKLISSSVGGVQLSPLDYPPQDIHPQPGWLYFELKTQGVEWLSIQKTGYLALSVSGHQSIPDLSVSLYGIYSR